MTEEGTTWGGHDLELMPKIPADLLEALRTINRLNNFVDAGYDVRERIDWEAPESKGVDCSWDHPNVRSYDDAVAVVMKYIK